jgi:hypothetical protein
LNNACTDSAALLKPLAVPRRLRAGRRPPEANERHVRQSAQAAMTSATMKKGFCSACMATQGYRREQ